jgi:Flp pilus assembly protein TadD
LLAWLGLGNAWYAQGDLDAAERAYSQLLTTVPNHAVALNNLSQVQAEQGCFEKAAATLDAALAASTSNTSMHEIIQKTGEEIGARRSTDACL